MFLMVWILCQQVSWAEEAGCLGATVIAEQLVVVRVIRGGVVRPNWHQQKGHEWLFAAPTLLHAWGCCVFGTLARS